MTSTVTTGIKEVIVTNPTGTLTITAGLVDIDKRQATMAAITPAASIFSSCDESPEDMSLLSTVSSACSCLLISPAVVTATSTTLTV